MKALFLAAALVATPAAAEAGVQYDRTHDESGFGAKAGLEAEYRLTAKWSAVAEPYYVISRVDSIEGRQFLAGVRYQF